MRLTIPQHQLTLSGNTAGALTNLSSGTVTLAGGNNITLSQVGNAVTISGAAAAGAQTAISGIAASNTTYTSGTVTFTGVGGGVTVSSNTGQRVDISVAAQSVQPETQTFIGGISASNTLYTSGSVRFTGSQAVTVRSGTGQLVVIDVPAQSVQPETQTFIAGIQNSQTTYTSGTVNLSVVAGNLTIRSTTGQAFQFSASQTVQPETQTFVGGIAASNTTYTSGTVTITGVGGGITVSSNTGQRIDLSVAAQSTQTQGVLSVGVSTGGNTSGNTTVNTGSRLVIVGSNGITASQGTAAGATTITLSGNTQTVQTQGILSMGVSTGGNTVGNTQVSTGSRFVLVASGNATASQATAAGASTVTISVGTQTVQTQDVLSVGASNVGNTSGNTTVNTGSRLVFAGGNNITISQGTAAGATTLTISGPNVGGAQTGISGLANSQTTYTSGSVTFSELGAITIRSTTGQQFQFSVNAQSVQPETQTFVAGIANSQTTYTSGTVSLSELGAITVRSTTGNQYQLSVNAYSAGISTNGNTAGDTGFASHRLALIGGNNITLSGSTNAGSMSLTISGPTVGGAQTGISGIANSQTTYTSGTVSLSELGAITIRSTTGNQFQFSVNAQTAQTGISGIANSQTTYTSGTVSLSELGAITIRSTTGNQYQFSVNAQTTQTQGILSAGVSTGGNTVGNTQVSTGSRFVLVASGNATASQATAAGASTVTISVGTQTVQTQDVLSIGVSTGGNTVGDTTVNTGSRFVIVGSNGITASQGTAAGATTITLSGVTQSTQTQGVPNLGVSNIGNTAGDTTVNSGTRFVLAGGNGITLSQSTAANATTITVSGGAGGAAFSGGMSTQGNTAGDTGYASQRLNLVGSNNITLSGSTNAGSMTISLFGPTPGAAQFSVGVSTGGNTAGDTGVSGTRIVHVATGAQTLSQATDATGITITHSVPQTSSLSATGAVSIVTNGSTISIGAPSSSLSATGNIQISTNGSTVSIGDGGGPNLADWQNFPNIQASLMTHIASISKTPFYWRDSIGGNLTANSLLFKMSMVTAASPASFSAHFGIYTFANSTSMNLLGSFSDAYVVSSASSVSFSQVRHWVMTGIQTHTALSTLRAGEYGFGMMFSATATNAMNASLYGAGNTGGAVGQILPGTNSMSTGTSQGQMPLFGRGSTTVNALPAAVVRSELLNQGSGASLQLHPWFYIRS